MNRKKQNDLKITALYCRLSLEDGKDNESMSISSQKLMLKDYAEKNGLFNCEYYVDDGYTGRNFNRPGFQRMISDIEKGLVSCVVTKDLSRLGRNYIEAGSYIEIFFPKHNVRYIAVTDGVDSLASQQMDITPFKNIMKKTKQILQEWKNSYEKQIVYDIENVFNHKKYDIVKHNFELKKLNKEHPQWLGDYDVFAVDIKNRAIWIVECKVIEKIATFYDMYRQQNRFFNEHKEDEKFQRRIDYLRENADKVIQELGCREYTGYKVIPYMCMNKVVVSRYKEVEFPIVSYSELVEIISKSGIEN